MKYLSESHSHCFTQDAAFYSGLVSAHIGESMSPFTLQVSSSELPREEPTELYIIYTKTCCEPSWGRGVSGTQRQG